MKAVDKQIIIKTLCTMATAFREMGHMLTPEQWRLYVEAVRIIDAEQTYDPFIPSEDRRARKLYRQAVKVRAINSRYVSNAKEVLEEAIAGDFETVIVFGFKDGNITWKKSAHLRTVEILGALEMAKRVLFDTQEAP